MSWTSNPRKPGHPQISPRNTYTQAIHKLTACYVSTKGFLQSCPGSLRKALESSKPDRNTWLASYTEEYNGLVAIDTFTTINRADLAASDFVGQPIPTMCVLIIKTDEFRNPVRAKNRIVILGNLESRMGTTAECYAPILRQDSLCLLTSIIVDTFLPMKSSSLLPLQAVPSPSPAPCGVSTRLSTVYDEAPVTKLCFWRSFSHLTELKTRLKTALHSQSSCGWYMSRLQER